jgi:hypothetical protein
MNNRCPECGGFLNVTLECSTCDAKFAYCNITGKLKKVKEI